MGPFRPPPEGKKRLYDESLDPLAPPQKAMRQGLPAFTEMDQDSFQFPPGSVNINLQEVGAHRPIALEMRRHSNKRLSFGRGDAQTGAQGPPLTPALIDLNSLPAEPAQAAAQAPTQSHLLAPGEDQYMSKEAIEEANKRYEEKEERLAEINKQRVALEAVEQQLAAAQKEIQRQADKKAQEALAASKKEQEKKEAEKKRNMAKKEKAAKEAAEKERKEKARVAEEKRKAAASLQASSLRIMKERLGSKEEELQRAKEILDENRRNRAKKSQPQEINLEEEEELPKEEPQNSAPFQPQGKRKTPPKEKANPNHQPQRKSQEDIHPLHAGLRAR